MGDVVPLRSAGDRTPPSTPPCAPPLLDEVARLELLFAAKARCLRLSGRTPEAVVRIRSDGPGCAGDRTWRVEATDRRGSTHLVVAPTSGRSLDGFADAVDEALPRTLEAIGRRDRFHAVP